MNCVNLRTKLLAIWEAIKDLVLWIGISFLLPIFHLFFILFSKNSPGFDTSLYNIVFVAIASFLTGVIFMTSFWKHNRNYVRMLFVISYLIAFGLFLVSRIQLSFNIEIFEETVFKWGVIISFLFLLIVGFYCKYDDKNATSRAIAEKAKGLDKGFNSGKEFKL